MLVTHALLVGLASSQQLDNGLLLLLVVMANIAAVQGQSGLALVVGDVGVQPSGHEEQAEIELSVQSSPVQSILPVLIDCG